MSRYAVLLAVILYLFLSMSSAFAQDVTQEAPEGTESTISEIFASLPQSRTEDGGFVVGVPEAPITIIEFADYACPHCQSYRPVIDQVIIDYVATGQAKRELRIFPTAGGQLTYYVGQVVECANHQLPGTYWQAYDLLYGYATSGEYDETVRQKVSDEYGLSYEKLLTCVEYAQQVFRDITLAQESGVTGTPGIMVRLGDGDAEFISTDGVTYARGGVDYEVLAQVIEDAQGEAL
jgi:protein-disulfide isomerase